MKTFFPPIRHLIRREHAEDYLLILLLSFAFSISATRYFLYLTHYPRIGSGELHFAHVLWGGLILFASSLIPLIFSNRWVYQISAAGSGIGVGLFIDEVGKFITRTNDYFYPAAAPVIYVFFLLVVLIYVRTKRPIAHNPRSQLYQIFDDFQEVLDNDLSSEEKALLEFRLEHVLKNSNQPDLTRLAASLQDFLQHQDLYLAPESPPGWLIRMKDSMNVWFTPFKVQAALVGGLLAWSLWSLTGPYRIISQFHNQNALIDALKPLVAGRFIRSNVSMEMYVILIGLQSATGLLIFICTAAISLRNNRTTAFLINCIYFLLLISLTVLTPLLFYFDQFSTIIAALVQFILLLLLIKYRRDICIRPN